MLRKGKGFSLIEILVVVAVISILAAIAMPAYNGYVNRSRIRTAQADLVALSLQFENRFQRMLAHPAAALANFDAIIAVFPGWRPASDQANFRFSTDIPAGRQYRLIATGIAGGVTGCVITINDQGVTNAGGCDLIENGEWL